MEATDESKTLESDTVVSPRSDRGRGRKLAKVQSTSVISEDLEQTQRILERLHPEKAEWLMSILTSYEQQGLNMAVSAYRLGPN